MPADTINITETPDTENTVFQKAIAFVRDTEENIFLTGKAGTGKTTFLKYIKSQTNKKCAVIAPTGVAAINAGGETIHSFLQLPFGPFVPGNAGGFGRQGIAEDKHSLLEKLRMRETKLNLLRKLELLIIDEVSMVRCDLLDEIDLVLRHVRKKWTMPFGGVQMVFIGDLFQLPPVAPEQDWEILRQFYASPYFFDAQVMQQNPPLYIELKKIYRQKEELFIDILNRVRNGNVQQQDIDALNRQYNPEPQKESGYIILSTHNRIADNVNQEALQRLGGVQHSFTGVIKNDFSNKNLPTEEVLQLKEGAQVMFVKNDLQNPRRYYNGKIATISAIGTDGIWIKFPDEPYTDPILLELETWKNIRYTLNTQKGVIEEEESGSFTQYPIRLAWAITVHKSQGLTLQKAIVDLSQSFAPGQVYVALSRCTSLQGLVLRSKLNIENVIVDNRVISFSQNENEEDELDAILNDGMRKARGTHLCRIFSFSSVLEYTEQLRPELLKRKTGPREQNMVLYERIFKMLSDANEHAEKFQRQILSLAALPDSTKLEERKKAGAIYFLRELILPTLQLIADHFVLLDTMPKIAKQTKAWTGLKEHLTLKESELNALLKLEHN